MFMSSKFFEVESELKKINRMLDHTYPTESWRVGERRDPDSVIPFPLGPFCPLFKLINGLVFTTTE